MRTDLGGGSWIHFEDPGDDEQATLRDDLGVSVEWIRDALDPYQRPRFQRSGDLALILVLCARTARRRPEPFATVPFGIHLLPAGLVTICRRDPDLMEGVRGAGDEALKDPRGTALMLLAANEEVFRNGLREVHDRSTFEEEELRSSLTGARLGELIDQGRSLAYFESALRSNDRMLDAVREDGLFGDNGEMQALLDEVRERNEENGELAAVFTRIHNDLMDGFSSLVSMNLNALVRTLTELTIALAVPAIVAAMWGMNVSVPFEDREMGFVLMAALVVTFAVATFLLIRFAERMGSRHTRRS